MIDYRPFRNSDTPQLVRLWHACELGRGAASGFSYEAFDRLVFSQQYFDARGFIVATDGSEVIAFVHAGFGVDSSETWIDHATGVLCAILVDPRYRRQGIGRQLVQQAENYLNELGSQTLQAGSAPRCDAFYLGLYGGSQVSGFLESDTLAAPFLAALGYQPIQQFTILQRRLEQGDPITFRLSLIRRKMETQIFALPEQPTWWWFSRFGRLENVHFRLIPKSGGADVAGVTVSGLDLYINRWGERAIGISDLVVKDTSRRQGHGQALLIEVLRRMRQEMATLAEAHVADDNPAALAMFRSVGFQPVDRGVVYQKSDG